MRRFLTLTITVALGATAFGQSWVSTYEAAQTSLKLGRWSEARLAFKAADSQRPGDVAAATTLPGPITERRTWRGGAPYSPVFLAAYAGYKEAVSTPLFDIRTNLLKEVAAELEGLHQRGQASAASYSLLSGSYQQLGNAEARAKAMEDFAKAGASASFRVDTEGVVAEDVAALPAGSAIQAAVEAAASKEMKPLVAMAPATAPKVEDAPKGCKATTNVEVKPLEAKAPAPAVTEPKKGEAAQTSTSPVTAQVTDVAKGCKATSSDVKPEQAKSETPAVVEPKKTEVAQPAPTPVTAVQQTAAPKVEVKKEEQKTQQPPKRVQPAGAPDVVVNRRPQNEGGGNPQQGSSTIALPANTVPATAVAPTAGTAYPVAANAGGRVAPVATKFALVVGTSDTRLSQEPIPFAADDAQQVRDALVTHAGYPEENVDLVLNATAPQILASAQALAERVGEGGTVFIYFSGPGVNVDGKDYLAGIDTEVSADLTSMLPKNDLYRLFMAKGAKIYAFYQVNRATLNGRYFGSEVPMVGSIAQVQATMPNGNVFSFVRGGKTIGLFTDALAGTMSELRSNRIPILEFGWQIFNRIRRGDTGTTGGGSRQIPTLPVLTNMASDSRF